MVIKGRARGGPAALATHLERRDTNEKVCVRELRGVTARDVLGALREMDCMGAGAISTRTLYHAAINTAPNERLTDEQKQRAIERLAAELGFADQPRIVVEHLKKSREHIHAIFLRIDTGRMVAIPDSHNYRKHETVARDLEREFGHRHVQGAHVERKGQERPHRTPSHVEMQQAERTGFSPQEAKRYVTKLWNQAESGKAFAAAMEAEGWVLAKGDSRDFVLIDPAGEIHSLARRIDGVKAAEVRQRMSDIDAASLPSVADARMQQRSQMKRDHSQKTEKPKAHEIAPQPVILKIETPSAKLDPSKRLSVPEGQVPAIEKKPASVPPEPQIESTSKRKSIEDTKRKPKSEPEPGRFKRFYTAASDATQRAFAKARSVLGKKKTPPKSGEQKAPRRSVATTQVRSAVTPAKKEISAKREASTRDKRQEMPGKTTEPKPPKKQSTVSATKSDDQNKAKPRDIKPRLSHEELDLMIGRQRQRRKEREGPIR